MAGRPQEQPPRHRLTRAQRERIFIRSGGICERNACTTAIDMDTFHVAHLRAHSNGGALVDENLAAWCSRCNLTLGARDACDTRLAPREWQLRALDKVVQMIARSQVATVAAAPGAGKTVFASLVFEALWEADLVDRMVVLAPRATIVFQWHDSLYRSRHIQIRPGAEVERHGERGVVVTYQSLNQETVEIHRLQSERARTLFVLDEVHHVGEPENSAWARYITDLVGDVRGEIHPVGVLNLSGTLWRSNGAERISTVRYELDDGGKILSAVDFEVTAAELIRDGQLRPVDLFRPGAIVDLAHLEGERRIISPIADLDDRDAARAAIRELPTDPAWRDRFVETVLERLKRRHRDFGNGPAKALIVARRIDQARAFQESANRLMRQHGMTSIAELAVSSDADARRTLERFRTMSRPGVLCTVDMAGEGYDCPDIVVVGFATNKLTPLYVRQVVARAQRVTQYERDKIGHPIPAAIVIPDVKQLVEVMSAILEPMRHEVADADPESQSVTRSGQGILPLPKYQLDGVDEYVDGDARVTGETDGDVAMALVAAVEPEARRVGLPESDAPRMIVAVRGALTTRRETRPFDPLSASEVALADALALDDAPQRSTEPVIEPLSIERTARGLREQLGGLGKWWSLHGDTPIGVFQMEVNRAGNIRAGGRSNASIEQLRAALRYARTLISARCQEAELPRPRIIQGDDEE
jgi:superfamily II DNA or RNA helicase